ncbi:MAG: dTDP-4-dehydrorhamnose 3,5-epimerase [Alphaproteobacteria bacterium]|nr:dTDP-4-dehydrorhamnose 3,5-epimerase [Alphaproteobacteria bacterium]
MQVTALEIPDVLEISPPKFGDHRGYFAETYNAMKFADATGLAIDWVQDNQSLSATPGTLRGLHFQAPPSPQAKLVRVLRGRIWDVAVDIRNGSPTYGKWVALELSEENFKQIFVPRGFAHGFITLEPDTIVSYKVDGYYDKEADAGLAWDDPTLAVAWPLDGLTPVLSEKDGTQPAFADFVSPFAYEAAR